MVANRLLSSRPISCRGDYNKWMGDGLAEDRAARLAVGQTPQDNDPFAHERTSLAYAQPRIDNLVFLCGFPSGGTDLLMSVMNAHHQIFIPGEFPLLPAMARTYGSTVAAQDVDQLIVDFLRHDGYRNFRNHHWTNFQANRKDEVTRGPLPPPDADGEYSLSTIYRYLLGVPDSVLWTGNKTPSNTEQINDLRTLFPSARFVVIARDVRDVALSWRRKWGKDEIFAAAKWTQRMQVGLASLAELGDSEGLLLTFEQLLDDLPGVCAAVCSFLGLRFDSEMLSFHQKATKMIDGKPNWGKPLIAGNYGKWRGVMSPTMVRRIEEIALPTMTALGYDASVAERHVPVTRLERLRGYARDAWATVAVHNRYAQNRGIRTRFRNVLFESKKLLSARQRSVG
jgi:sulfotransferase family protein